MRHVAGLAVLLVAPAARGGPLVCNDPKPIAKALAANSIPRHINRCVAANLGGPGVVVVAVDRDHHPGPDVPAAETLAAFAGHRYLDQWSFQHETIGGIKLADLDGDGRDELLVTHSFDADMNSRTTKLSILRLDQKGKLAEAGEILIDYWSRDSLDLDVEESCNATLTVDKKLVVVKATKSQASGCLAVGTHKFALVGGKLTASK